MEIIIIFMTTLIIDYRPLKHVVILYQAKLQSDTGGFQIKLHRHIETIDIIKLMTNNIISTYSLFLRTNVPKY